MSNMATLAPLLISAKAIERPIPPPPPGIGGGGMGGYQAIMINPETGMLHGGTDPRKDGQVAGY